MSDTKSPPLTSEEIGELERLEKAATPAPWGKQRLDECRFFIVGPNGGLHAIATTAQGHDEENAALIAAMRNALPRLLSSLKRGKEEGSAAQVPPPIASTAEASAASERWRYVEIGDSATEHSSCLIVDESVTTFMLLQGHAETIAEVSYPTTGDDPEAEQYRRARLIADAPFTRQVLRELVYAVEQFQTTEWPKLKKYESWAQRYATALGKAQALLRAEPLSPKDKNEASDG